MRVSIAQPAREGTQASNPYRTVDLTLLRSFSKRQTHHFGFLPL
jgi:hypothetical protein